MRFLKSKKRLNLRRTFRQLMGSLTSTSRLITSLLFLPLGTRIIKWKTMRLRMMTKIKIMQTQVSSFHRM
jgi:hypothetical protein